MEPANGPPDATTATNGLNGLDSLDATTKQLWRAFMQLGRTQLHHQSVAGSKPSEIRALMGIRGCMKSPTTPIKVAEIIKWLNITPPAVTQILNSLEAQGLVERHNDPSDRRAVRLTLTEKGQKVTQHVLDMMSAYYQGLVEYLGEEKSQQLADLLQSANQYFNEKLLVWRESSNIGNIGRTENTEGTESAVS